MAQQEEDSRGIFVRFRSKEQKKKAKIKAIEIDVSLQQFVIDSIEKCYPDLKGK